MLLANVALSVAFPTMVEKSLRRVIRARRMRVVASNALAPRPSAEGDGDRGAISVGDRHALLNVRGVVVARVVDRPIGLRHCDEPVDATRQGQAGNRLEDQKARTECMRGWRSP